MELDFRVQYANPGCSYRRLLCYPMIAATVPSWGEELHTNILALSSLEGPCNASPSAKVPPTGSYRPTRFARDEHEDLDLAECLES